MKSIYFLELVGYIVDVILVENYVELCYIFIKLFVFV